MRHLIAAFLLGLMVIAPVHATVVYDENFNDAFPNWESRYLGIQSNLENVYGVGADRGNNPNGLWIQDGLSLSNETRIIFDTIFGQSLTELSIDITTHASNINFEIFDSLGATLLSYAMPSLNGGNNCCGEIYETMLVTSTTGIGGFRFLGNGIEGNTAIDNVIATADGIVSVPEPAPLAIIGLGLAALAWTRRKA